MRSLKYTVYVSFILLLTMAYSCQKVINVHLNSSSPQYVIEGNVTDQPGPYVVNITRSVDFDQDNVYPTVSGAKVVITDNTAGVIDTLKETTAGHYQTSILAGVPGHSYSLYISADSKIYTASSTMPMPISLDSLYSQKSAFGSDNEVVPVYTDPIATGNYYHFLEVINDTVSSSVLIRNDNLINGQTIRLPLNGGSGNLTISTGDIVGVYLECIDSPMYQYYFGLQQSSDQNSASPANPASNITGGCLGYFSAHTSSYKNVVIQ